MALTGAKTLCFVVLVVISVFTVLLVSTYAWPSTLKFDDDVRLINEIQILSSKLKLNVERLETMAETVNIPKMEEALDFLNPDVTHCEDIVQRPFHRHIRHRAVQSVFDELEKYNRTIMETITTLEVKKRRRLMEGYCSANDEQTLVMAELASLDWVRTVCETGFNAGHSSLVWLIANPNAHVYSFDINRHPLTSPMAEYLKRRFPGRFNITFGDSVETLPQFRLDHPDIKCDLAITDGGHTIPVARSDLENFYQMTNSRNIAFFDNHPDQFEIGAPWETLKRRGLLTEYFRCRYGLGKKYGFTFGQYLH